MCEALAARAGRLTEAAPPVYCCLTGKFGRATKDTAWEALLQPGAAPGLGFVTNGVSRGHTPNSRTFPDGSGIRLGVMSTGAENDELMDSDVVCFRSAPAGADGTLHSLVRTRQRRFDLPPMATVTLEQIQQPGEWVSNGHRVRQRLFTVSVSYRPPWGRSETTRRGRSLSRRDSHV